MKSREQLEDMADWFDCQESERLQHTSAVDAVGAAFDALDSQADNDAWVAGTVDVRVDCYVKGYWTDSMIEHLAGSVVDHLVDYFDNDEDLSGEDGLELDKDESSALVAAARILVEKFIHMAPPWPAKFIGSFDVPGEQVAQWVAP